MAQNDEVKIEYTIEERAALKALAKLTKEMDSFENDATKNVKKVDSAWSSFTGNLAAIGTSRAIQATINGIKGIASESVRAAANAERLRTQFEVLTGSQQTANELFEQLKEFSAGTPFQLNNIADASAQLLSFGFASETVAERIEKIGEVAAGSNSDLQEVALIYGQVAAAGKLTGERLLQLQERAVPIGSALANTLGVAESKVKDLVSQGVVGFREFERAFNSLSESGGIFEGAIDKQSQTINGLISTLQDNFELLKVEIGETFQKDLKDAINLSIEGLQELKKLVKENEGAIRAAFGFVQDYVKTYASLAASVLKTETPMELFENKIVDTIDKIQESKEKIEELQSISKDGIFGFGVFTEGTAGKIEETKLEIAALEKELTNLVNTRNALIRDDEKRKAESKEGESKEKKTEDKRAEVEAEVNEKILQQRRDLGAKLAVTEEEQAIRLQEIKLMRTDLDEEQRKNEISKITEHELSKADIEYNAAIEKNKKIFDAESRALADKQALAKKEIAIENAKVKEKQRIAQLDRQILQTNLNAAQGFLQAGITLAKDGSRQQKALQVANATVSTYTAATQALSSPPGPPFTIPLSAAIVAQGLANIVKINRQSFASGGVVGGFSGASVGQDNTVVNARVGEMMLNAQQQRRLFEIANNNTNTSNDTADAINRLASQPIVLTVDGREIARATRDQIREGFKL